MIEFPCHCGFKFSVPQDQAGGMVQCPECRRLNDVPTPGEMEILEEDGAYKLGPEIEPAEDPQERLRKAARAFTRDRYDQSGQAIDFRLSYDDLAAAGTDDAILPLADEVDMHAPQYNPLTGELIRPIDIKRDPSEAEHVAAIPLAARAPELQYEHGDLLQPLPFRKLAMELLIQPGNLFVMSIILMVHIVLQPANLMMRIGFLIALPIWLFETMFFLSHYANVVEDGGPGERDELPRPLRDVSFYDDLWRPFVNFTFSLFLCFWPILLALKLGASRPVMGGVALAGSFFFPAVLLTMTTSGSIVNMRPDRVFGVMRAIGSSYIFLFSLMFAALLTYAIGLLRYHVDTELLLLWQSQARALRAAEPWWFKPWFAYPALLVGIYLMHFFCWSLGATYRLRHDRFPWVLQRHIRAPEHMRVKSRGSVTRNLNANSAKVKSAQSRAAAPPR